MPVFWQPGAARIAALSKGLQTSQNKICESNYRFVGSAGAGLG